MEVHSWRSWFARAAALELIATVFLVAASVLSILPGASQCTMLVGFGIASFIELVPTAIRAWRFSVDAVGAIAPFEAVDAAMERFSRIAYFCFTGYGLFSGVRDFAVPYASRNSATWAGCLAIVLAMLGMALVISSKRALTTTLANRALALGTRDGSYYLALTLAIGTLVLLYAILKWPSLDIIADGVFVFYGIRRIIATGR